MLDIDDYSFARLTLILLLHYLVKLESRSLAQFFRHGLCIVVVSYIDLLFVY